MPSTSGCAAPSRPTTTTAATTGSPGSKPPFPSAGWPGRKRSGTSPSSCRAISPPTSAARTSAAMGAANRPCFCTSTNPRLGVHLSRLLEGRVAIVTGAGRGIGRAHALELARHGAKVVVNDYGVTLAGENDGGDAGESPAHAVVKEIEALGGEAVVNGADVADFDAAAAMVQQ